MVTPGVDFEMSLAAVLVSYCPNVASAVEQQKMPSEMIRLRRWETQLKKYTYLFGCD